MIKDDVEKEMMFIDEKRYADAAMRAPYLCKLLVRADKNSKPNETGGRDIYYRLTPAGRVWRKYYYMQYKILRSFFCGWTDEYNWYLNLYNIMQDRLGYSKEYLDSISLDYDIHRQIKDILDDMFSK